MLGKLINVEGDVTNPQITAKREVVFIPHCCNDKGVMGAGVAKSLKDKWPKVYNAYEAQKTKNINFEKYVLGDISYARVQNYCNGNVSGYKTPIYVVNMIGQQGTVSDSNPKPLKYCALIKAMVMTRQLIGKVIANYNKHTSHTFKPVIHCPKFGSKLANGDWNFILELIREIWLESGIDVVIYEYNG